jgi:murein DD-endopeptidase MepM/ murein hydrolase activator NlpD
MPMPTPILRPLLTVLLLWFAWSVTAGTATARASAVTPGGRADSATSWVWPVRPAYVVRSFAVGPYPWSPGHRGVDLAASPGTRVVSPAAGVVTFSGSVAGRGVLVITHPSTGAGRIRSSFEPVTALVAVGTSTVAGQIVAEVAPAPGGSGPGPSPGHCRSPACVHWGVRIGASYVDPAGLVGIRRVVLLPVGAVR